MLCNPGHAKSDFPLERQSCADSHGIFGCDEAFLSDRDFIVFRGGHHRTGWILGQRKEQRRLCRPGSFLRRHRRFCASSAPAAVSSGTGIFHKGFFDRRCRYTDSALFKKYEFIGMAGQDGGPGMVSPDTVGIRLPGNEFYRQFNLHILVGSQEGNAPGFAAGNNLLRPGHHDVVGKSIDGLRGLKK